MLLHQNYGALNGMLPVNDQFNNFNDNNNFSDNNSSYNSYNYNYGQ